MHHAPEALKEEGYKITPQRLLIWHVLQEGGHPTIDQIRAKVDARLEGVDLSTIYRTMDLLVRLRLAAEIRLADGRCCYDVVEEGASGLDHHHFVCMSCGEISDLPDGQVSECVGRTLAARNYRLGRVELTATGVCPKCTD